MNADEPIKINGRYWITRDTAASIIGVHPGTISRLMETPVFFHVDQLKIGASKVIDRDQFMEAAPNYRKRNVWTTEPKHGEEKKTDKSFAKAVEDRLPKQDELLAAIRNKDIAYIKKRRLSWESERA